MTSLLIATGGTIAWSEQESRMLNGLELSHAAGLKFDSIVDVNSKPSWDLSLSDMFQIGASVCSAIDAGHRSIVVTHGTDTMEETAWLTDLMLGNHRRMANRVIFTGAMKFADTNESDGIENLKYALANSEQAEKLDQGVQVAFAGELFAARWVRKIDAFELKAFSGGGRPSSSGPLPPAPDSIDVNVKVVTTSSVARQSIPSDASGIVLVGTGASHVPSAYFEEIERTWSQGIPVVISSRSRDVARTYRPNDDVLWAGDLSSEKAAIALMAALGKSHILADVCEWWAELMSESVR
ncbi:MAG TPA: asparaginase [Acidimicrobiales bacterium]|nr:asparaginase [Acidimicrobiales bacterium]